MDGPGAERLTRCALLLWESVGFVRRRRRLDVSSSKSATLYAREEGAGRPSDDRQKREEIPRACVCVTQKEGYGSKVDL